MRLSCNITAVKINMHMVMKYAPGGELFDKLMADEPLEVSPS